MPRDEEFLKNIKSLEKGQMLMKYNKMMASCAWKDKRMVPILTTMHNPSMVMTIKIDYTTGQYIKQPNINIDYNI